LSQALSAVENRGGRRIAQVANRPPIGYVIAGNNPECQPLLGDLYYPAGTVNDTTAGIKQKSRHHARIVRQIITDANRIR